MTKFKVQDITSFALLSAFCVVGRLLTGIIPNAQPITAIIILITLNMGVFPAFIVCCLSIIITNLFLGMGIWTIAQIFAYSIVIIFVGVVKQTKILYHNLIFQILVCLICSFLYGFLVSATLAPFFSIQSFIPYYLSGLPFDVTHAISTVFFFLAFKHPFILLLKK